jgi:hypothetical protein
MRLGGRTVLVNVPADQCQPIGDPRPDGSYAACERVWIEKRPQTGDVATGMTPADKRFLRREIHTAGRIVNELWSLDAAGKPLAKLDLAAFYGAGAPLPEIVTGVDEPLLDFVPNFTVGGRSVSDFDGAEELVDQFTASVSQAAGVIAKHADPKLGIPEDSFGEDGKVKATDDAFAFRSKDEIPTYLTWDAQMAAALKLIEFWLDQLLAVIEMSPALLGMRKGAAPDAYKKLRLECTNTLSKVARKKLYWTRFIRDRYRVAAKLDNATPGTRYEFADVEVEWHDGIPLDEQELTDALASQRQAGLVDQETAVETLYGPAKAVQIMERLKEEGAAANRITMNLGETVIGDAGTQPDDSLSASPRPRVSASSADGGAA